MLRFQDKMSAVLDMQQYATNCVKRKHYVSNLGQIQKVIPNNKTSVIGQTCFYALASHSYAIHINQLNVSCCVSYFRNF